MDSTHSTYDGWIGCDAFDATGAKLGEIKDIFYDDVTGRPEWVSVKPGLMGGQCIAPIAGAEIMRHTDSDETALKLAYTKDQIKDSPDVDFDDEHLDPTDEQELYAHYGFTHGNATATGTYGNAYGKVRPDVDYPAARYDREAKRWGEETVEVPVQTKVEIPVDTTVRLRRYQTQQRRTEKREVEVPVTETEEHVEVVGTEGETGTTRARNA